MSYVTENETEHFDFEEAVIVGIEKHLSSVHLYLDNVKILPENSMNRDIRKMRTNGLDLCITDGVVEKLVDEGYQVYDVNGKLRLDVPDREIGQEDYEKAFQDLADASLDGIEKTGDVYIVSIRTEDHTARLEIRGSGDREQWDRFMNL